MSNQIHKFSTSRATDGPPYRLHLFALPIGRPFILTGFFFVTQWTAFQIHFTCFLLRTLRLPYPLCCLLLCALPNRRSVAKRTKVVNNNLSVNLIFWTIPFSSIVYAKKVTKTVSVSTFRWKFEKIVMSNLSVNLIFWTIQFFSIFTPEKKLLKLCLFQPSGGNTRKKRYYFVGAIWKRNLCLVLKRADVSVRIPDITGSPFIRCVWR